MEYDSPNGQKLRVGVVDLPSFYGDANPYHDFPMLLDLYTAGRLNLDDMVTNTYTIDEAPQAIEDLQKGINARGVIVF